jgi:TetR/AcrR family transcriptional regulator, regulator of biofilm formation and stress response
MVFAQREPGTIRVMARPVRRRSRAASRPRPRQSRSELTRQRLLEAALARLAEGGPAAVTHRAVAEQAGVSLGAATYYFASKYDLLEEVYRLHLKRIRERVEDLRGAIAGPRASAVPADRKRLIAGLVRYLELGVLEDRAGSLATFELALERARDPVLRSRLRVAKAESDAYAAKILGMVAPGADSELLIAALNGLRMAWLAEGVRSSFARRVPQLIARLADGIVLAPRARRSHSP